MAAAGAAVALGPMGCDTGAGTGLGTAVLAGATRSLCTGHPRALLPPRGGGGSTRGAPHSAARVPAPRGSLPGVPSPVLVLCPRPWRSSAVSLGLHIPLPPPLVAVTVSVRRGTFGTETAPAAPCPSLRCCGRGGGRWPRTWEAQSGATRRLRSRCRRDPRQRRLRAPGQLVYLSCF